MVNGNETKDFAITLDFAKHITMMARTEKSHEYREYLIKCEIALKQLSKEAVHLTHKQKLALTLFEGGTGAVVAHKELLTIQTEEIKEKHKIELKQKRDGNNRILSGVWEVVQMLNIKGLTTKIFTEWMVDKGLGQYILFDGDTKKTFQPTKLFIDYVSKEGYSLTGKTYTGKIKVIYTTEFVTRIMDKHMASIVEFVRILGRE